MALRTRAPIAVVLTLLVHGVTLFMLAAGILKLIDIRQFASDLRTWTLIPPWLHAPLSIAIPLIESGAAAAWLLTLAHRHALTATVVLLSSFTAVYAAQALLVAPPACGCFGAVFRHERTTELAWEIVGRNLALVSVLVAGGPIVLRSTPLPCRRTPAPTGANPRGGASDRPRRRPGFTLLELLIVIAVIALVVSLTLPQLARVRVEAQQLKSLANLRTHAQTLSTYTGDSADTLPYFTDPLATASVVRGGGLAVAIPYFFLSQTWNVALADEYLGGNAHPGSMQVPWKMLSPPYTHYYYGDCFIARPEYWRYETRRADTTQWRRTLLSEVAFPSAKGLVFEQGWTLGPRGLIEIPPDARVALTDGSATEHPYARFLPVYLRGIGTPPGPAGGYAWGVPTMHTIDGVLGRDLP